MENGWTQERQARQAAPSTPGNRWSDQPARGTLKARRARLATLCAEAIEPKSVQW